MIVLHHDDSDGRLAAYIVARRAVQGSISSDTATFIEMTYDKQVPFDKIPKGETVWIVDFSIPPGDMKKLLKITPNVIWIDHHKSAIERYADWDGPDIKGTREVGKSGCLLTWEYLYPKAAAPGFVKLVDDYDIWAFKYGDETRNFYFGAMCENTDPGPGCLWEQLWDDKAEVGDIVNAGRAIRSYLDNLYEGHLKNVYEVEYRGLVCLVLNTPIMGSQAFKDRINKYDMCMTYCWNGRQWRIGFYSTKSNVDCSEQAMWLGGGGHKGAAGAHVDHLPQEFGDLPCERNMPSDTAEVEVKRMTSQNRETLDKAEATIHKRISPTEVVLKIDGKFELWAKNDNFAGYVIEIDGKGYEFVRGVPDE